MATYEYKCTDEKCNNEWEEIHSMTSPPITTCPKCNQETAQRLISGGTGFRLVGQGWFNSGGY